MGCRGNSQFNGNQILADAAKVRNVGGEDAGIRSPPPLYNAISSFFCLTLRFLPSAGCPAPAVCGQRRQRPAQPARRHQQRPRPAKPAPAASAPALRPPFAFAASGFFSSPDVRCQQVPFGGQRFAASGFFTLSGCRGPQRLSIAPNAFRC